MTKKEIVTITLGTEHKDDHVRSYITLEIHQNTLDDNDIFLLKELINDRFIERKLQLVLSANMQKYKK